MDKTNLAEIKKSVIKVYENSKIVFTKKDIEDMDICDLGLGDFYRIGISIIIYINTKKVCAKEMALTPDQICPQHRHPDIAGETGKEETFRCRWGEVYLYIPGPETKNRMGKIPKKYKNRFSVFHEILLKPGDQYTLKPNTWHWFQAGPKGAVLSEFSTHSYDAGDIFYDKKIKRTAKDN